MSSLRTTRIAIAVCLLLAGATVTRAQPLADRVPADALLYIGWAGSEHLGDAYAQSRLKSLMDASAVPQLLAELPPKLLARVGGNRPGAMENAHIKEFIAATTGLSDAVLRHPMAFYVGPVNLNARVPLPRMALFCQAGKEARPLADRFEKLIKDLPPEAPVKFAVQVWPGDVLVISTFEIGARIEESLSQREAFVAAMKQGVQSPVVAAYFDAEKVINVASLGINMAAGAREAALWRQILVTTGVSGVKRLALTGGFDGRDWATQAFIDAPAPRSGLLANVLSSKPVSDGLLRWAPKSTSWLAATRFEMDEALRVAGVLVGRFSPEQGKEFDEGLAALNKALGMDLQKDLLAALGDGWLIYTSDDTAQGAPGICLVNPLRDRAKAEASLDKIGALAGAALARERGPRGPVIELKTEKIGDLTVRRLPLPGVDPCWTIKGDNLYVALYPQVLLAATRHDGSAARSVLANDAFVAARKRVGVAGGAETTIAFADLPRLAPRTYPFVLALVQSGAGMLDLLGFETPPLLVPPLPKILNELTPAGAAVWVDAAGWHYRSVTPFPGAQLLAGEQPLLAGIPAVLGWLVMQDVPARHEAPPAPIEIPRPAPPEAPARPVAPPLPEVKPGTPGR